MASLVKVAREYNCVFVIVGDNDAKTQSMHSICQKFEEIRDAVFPTKVKFAGHLRRKDLPQELVAKNNMFYRNKLGFQMKSTKIVRREDFDDNCNFHFNKYGEGYRHLAALILSVLKEFCDE